MGGFNLFDPSTYGQGVQDVGNGLSNLGNSLGFGSQPAQNQQTYKIDQSAFNNPAGNVAPQLGSALKGYTGNAYQPVNPMNGYTSGAGSGLEGLGAQYMNLANGQGPSLANVQAQQQGAQNLAQTESLLGSARGAGSPAAAQLAAQNALTSGQQQTAQNAVQGRTAEELGALGGAGAAFGALGGLGGQVNQVNQGNQAVNAQVQSQYLQALAQQNAQQQQGAIAGQQLGSNNQLGFNTLQSGNFNTDAGRKTNFLGSALQGGSGLLSTVI